MLAPSETILEALCVSTVLRETIRFVPKLLPWLLRGLFGLLNFWKDDIPKSYKRMPCRKAYICFYHICSF